MYNYCHYSREVIVSMRALCLICLMFITTASVYADHFTNYETSEPKASRFYVGGGLTLPNNPDEFNDYWKMGFNVSLGAGYYVPPIHSTIRIQARYNNFGFDKNDYLGYNSLSSATYFSVNEPSITVQSVSLEAKYMTEGMDDNRATFLIGGIGVANVSSDDIVISDTETGDTSSSPGVANETKLCINAGLGMDYLYRNILFSAEASFMVVFMEDERMSLVPITIGVVF